MKRISITAFLVFASCNQVDTLVFPGGGSGVVGDAPVVPSATVARIQINGPGRIQNGSEQSYDVTLFTNAGTQVIAPWRAAIEGPAVLRIISPVGTTLGNDVVVKAQLIGDDNQGTLVVISGEARGEFTIQISPATP